MQLCKKCQSLKSSSEFYSSNRTSCKECVKAQVRSNREGNISYYRSYDRMRYREDDKRKEGVRKGSNSPASIAAKERYKERTRELSPEKNKARNAVANGLRDGKLKRGETCFFCSETEKLQAHHSDYSRPLDVYWLCPRCHGKLHAINGDFLKPLAVTHG